jgi:hypothetical protein
VSTLEFEKCGLGTFGRIGTTSASSAPGNASQRVSDHAVDPKRPVRSLIFGF